MASAVAGLATGVGIGVGYGALSEYARLGILWAKWKALPYDTKVSKIAEAMQSILNAEKNQVSGLSTKGAVDAIYSFIDKTLDFAWMVDEGIATQMFVQMIQQSIAYAIHSSHAGSIGTIGNVYSGSMYLSATESMAIGENVENIDRYTKAFLSAEVGQNIPTLAFNLVRGANRHIEDVYRSVMTNMGALLDEWNDLALSYYRHYHSMARERFANSIQMKESATDRAYGLLEQVAGEHLARISEELDTLEGAKAWFDANLMSSSELADIAIRIDLERGASEANYDEYKTNITGAITSTIAEWNAKITQALGDLTDNENKYKLLMRYIFGSMFADVVDFTNSIVADSDQNLEDVCAYRNVEKAVQITSEYTPVPYPPILELERAFKDLKIQIPAEQSYYVENIPDNAKWYKLIYTKKLGKVSVPFADEAVPDFASFMVDRGIIQSELKSFAWSVYTDVHVSIFKRQGVVGETIQTYPDDDPDFICWGLWASVDNIEYQKECERLDYFNYGNKNITPEDTLYLHVWLGARNYTGSPQTGTVYCKNLKTVLSCGHLQM